MNELSPLVADRNLRTLRVFLAGFALIWLVGAQAVAEGRVALVVGNSAYQNATPLPNPVNDARAIAAKLTEIGFDVMLRENLDGQGFRMALGEFSEKALNADLALVFYAGHGIELNGQNYLIPIDAKMRSEATAQYEAVALEQVLGAVRVAGKLGLVMLDACRNDPFSATMTRSNGTRAVSRGLAPISVEGETGILISFAAEAGRTAEDGLGDHSPYTAALLGVLDQPGLEVGRMFRSVRARVKETTAGAQVPIEQAQLPDQDIYLVAANAPTQPVATVTTTATATIAAANANPAAPADDPLLLYLAAIQSGDRTTLENFIRRYPDHERTPDARAVVADMAETDFWDDIHAKNSPAAYRAYLLGFPKGRYRAEAEAAIAASEPVSATAVVTVVPAPEPASPASEVLGNCPVQNGQWSVKDIASDDTLFVRTGPGTSNPEVGELAYNATGITVTNCQGNWCEVQYGCISGFASAKYLTDETAYNATSEYSGLFHVVDHPLDQFLNVRTGPGEEYAVVAELPPDAAGLLVTDCQSVTGYDYRWCNLSWNAVAGWAYGRFLQNNDGQNPMAVVATAVASGDMCFDLWYQRNEIYAANGYCFGTDKGKKYFSNDGCYTATPDLGAAEQTEVDAIKMQEKRNGC